MSKRIVGLNKKKTAIGLIALLGAGVGAAMLLSKKSAVDKTCPTGQHWDETTQKCVVDTHTCPTGYHWNGTSCVVDTHTCATGTHWDEVIQQCVEDVHECPEGQHWDSVTQACVVTATADYVCSYKTDQSCATPFYTLADLQEHVRTVHPSERIPIEVIWS